MKLYQRIAQLVDAMKNCRESGNDEWYFKHRETITELVKDHLPSGSGFDLGTHLVFKDKPDAERLEFTTGFHHMNAHGYYTGWTNHAVIVTPSLAHGLVLRVTGRDRHGIKDYIGECFHDALNKEVA